MKGTIITGRTVVTKDFINAGIIKNPVPLRSKTKFFQKTVKDKVKIRKP
jgi:hypothetical protein